MADAAISALVSDVLGRLTSAAFQEYGLLRGLEADLSALKNTFRQIQAVLHDAEMRQTKEKDVEEWLRILKLASLEVENVLDEASTQALIQRLTNEKGFKSKVRAFSSSRYNPFMVKTRIAHKVKNIKKKLDLIDANRTKFKLDYQSGDPVGYSAEILEKETSSPVNLSKICGRDEEKMMMIHTICNQNIGVNDVGDVRVYAIWGMGGIGKTTLAQLVYNHEMVKAHFEIKFWVYVSNVFDIRRIIKSICGSKDSQLDLMQLCLKNKLQGKKFFIVLDDVWIENKDMEKWDELCKVLSCGAKGSTVMVTTRNNATSQMMAKVTEMQYNVRQLSEEAAWSLFEMLAFPGGREGENIGKRKHIGRMIVEKCKGLPLAVKMLGSLMLSKHSAGEWETVDKNIMWELQENGILPALRLSYDNLLPHMRRCFAYCCLFSKGDEISKNILIELWIANGFIPPRGDVRLYELGEEIFNCLAWRCFFIDVKEDQYRGKICKMHDLMHDLARYVVRHDCLVIETGKESITLNEEILHLSLSCEDFYSPKDDLKKMKSLRSMLVFDYDFKSSVTHISNHVYLRVLHLNRLVGSTLPESICELIHLRYLKISYSEIQVLPESIIHLQNLQVIRLKFCYEFRKLPKGMKYMRNLQRLDTGYCPALHHMPVGIKELANLRRLSDFVVGKNDGAKIRELGSLNILGWELRLSSLENVGGLEDAKSANLKDKRNLVGLVLEWSEHEQHETSDEEVLEGLEPSSVLQNLTISNYIGNTISPSWLVKLRNLARVHFFDIANCKHLPPLGKLPSLKCITLENMRSLKCFHDDDSARAMDNVLFCSLQELWIYDCLSLTSLPSNFPELTNFDLIRSYELDSLPCNLTKLKDLYLQECTKLGSLPSDMLSLRSLVIERCDRLGSLPDEIQNFKDLNRLCIRQCKILSRRYEKGIGENWLKISHIPHLDIQATQ